MGVVVRNYDAKNGRDLKKKYQTVQSNCYSNNFVKAQVKIV